jgi:hypothetical protein
VSAEQFAPIKPQALAWIDRISKKRVNLTQHALQDSEYHPHSENGVDGQLEAVDAIAAPPLSTVAVNGVNHEPTVTAALVADVVLAQDGPERVAGEGVGGDQLDNDDKLSWLADAANNAPDDPRDKLFDTINVVPKAAPRQPRLTLSADALEKYLAKMSWQRRDAFTWLDKNIEAVLQADIDNELSFRKAMTDINKGKPKSRQISHETVRKAFNDYCKVSDYEAVKMSAS